VTNGDVRTPFPDPVTRRARLREVLAAPELTLVPGVTDAFTARLAELAGFEVTYLSGAGFSVGALGLPDIGLASMTEVASHTARVCADFALPVIVDADTGYGTELNVFRTVRLLIAAGAAAVQLEDQAEGKKCGHLDGKRVVSRTEHLQRLQAAREASAGSGLVLVARTDARAPEGFAAALDRAVQYQESADVIFFEAPESLEEISTIARAIDKPLIFNLVANGRTPPVPMELLQELGYAMSIVPGLSIKTIAASVLHEMKRLRTGESWTELQQAMSSRAVFDLVGYQEWSARERRLQGTDKDESAP
jgi:2-methylisocitrate lyase-like PEP mutase family enzyme